MADPVAIALSEGIAGTWERIKASSGDCRVVFPAPTQHLARHIHSELLARGFPSYEVVLQGHGVPSEVDRVIFPDAVTSVRDGSFICVVGPGVLSHLQDSISGSGGGIRGLAIPDEWPWRRGEGEFQFEGTFLERWCLEAGFNPTSRDAVQPVIGLAKECLETNVDRATVMFEEILGGNLQFGSGDAEAVFELIRHVGMPAPDGGLPADLSAVGAWMKTFRVEIGPLASKMRGRAARETAKQNLDKAFEQVDSGLGTSRDQFESMVDELIDRLNRTVKTYHGALALRGVLPLASNQWRVFTLGVLQRLFEDPQAPEIAASWAESDASSGQLVLEGSEFCLSSRHPIPAVKVELKRPFEEVLRVGVKQGQSKLGAMDIAAGEVGTRIAIQAPKKQSASIRVTASTSSGGSDSTTSLKLEQIGSTGAPFAVVPDFDKSGSVKSLKRFEMFEDDHEGESLEISSSTPIYVIAKAGDVAAQIDGIDQMVEPIAEGIFRLFVDPAGALASSSQPELTILSEGYSTTLALLPAQSGGSHLDLESALSDAIQSGASKRAINSLHSAAIGCSEALQVLGSPTGADLLRTMLANDAFESEDSPWLPVVLGSEDRSDLRLVRAHQLRTSPESLERLPHGLLSEPKVSSGSLDCLNRYVSCRNTVMALLDAKFGKFSRAGLPKYCAYFLCIGDEDAFETAISNYVGAYAELVARLTSAPGDCDFGGRFLLGHLDCLVIMSGNETGALALGPWHPLTIAKRAVRGRALLRAAGLGGRGQRVWLDKLVGQLAAIAGFKWFPVVGGTTSQLVAMAADSTEDPGWIACRRVDKNLPGAIAQLERFGIRATWSSVSEGIGFTSYLSDYIKAFPSKRAIVARLSASSGIGDVATGVRRLLTTADGEATACGIALRGGVHLVLDSSVPDGVQFPQWGSPPVCVYDQGGTGLLSEAVVDLHLIPQASTTAFLPLSVDERTTETPRGAGYSALLHLPLRRLEQGAGQLHVTRLFESSVPENFDFSFGGNYRRAISVMQDSCVGGYASVIQTHQTSGPDSRRAVWTVVPGENADPAVLLEWAGQSAASGSPKVLWDFKMALTRSARSYYVMSEVPRGLIGNISHGGFFETPTRAGHAIMELAQLGIALGAECYKSRTKSLGVVGLIGSARLLHAALTKVVEIGADHGPQIFFTLPIDSFQDVLGADSETEPDSFTTDARRADLLAVVCKLGHSDLELGFCSTESKYCGGVFSDSKAKSALTQAKRSLDRALALCAAAREEHALAERLALARLLEFGFRLNSTLDSTTVSRILSLVLNGDFRFGSLGQDGCFLVSTELGIEAPALATSELGTWVRLCPSAWPGEQGHVVVEQLVDKLALHLRPAWAARATAARGQTVPVDAPTSDAPVHTNLPNALDFSTESAPLVDVWLGVEENGHPTRWREGENANNNIMITGSSGSGKTQLVKSIITQVRLAKLPVAIVDFKNDFASDQDFLNRAALDVQYVSFDGLPYNPLIPSPQPDPRTGSLVFAIGQHIAGIVSAFQRPYGLGEQQAAALKDAIRDALQSADIPSTGMLSAIPPEFPDFRIVGDALRERNEKAYNRLDPIFDLEIFRDSSRGLGFSTVLGKGIVIDLSSIHSAPIQNTLAQLVVYSAHRYLNALPHSLRLRQLLVFDEAHRVLKSEDIERLVRECRAYGMSVLLSSQYPDDFPKDTAANLAAKIIHGNGPDMDRVRAIQQALGAQSDSRIGQDHGVFHAAFATRPGTLALGLTIGLAHWIVLEALRMGPLSEEQLSLVPGVHLDRLDGTLAHLHAAGLVESHGGVWQLR